MTPRISLFGMRFKFGESVSKTNLLTPIGTGPTDRTSRLWSNSDLMEIQQVVSAG